MKMDAEHCHKQAMMTVARLDRDTTSTNTDAVTVEQTFIASAIAAPELTGGAMRFVASPFLLVLGALAMFLLR